MFVKVDLPPGLLRNGTAYGATGRWYDANLVRFFEGQKRPIGGWRMKSDGLVFGAARAIMTWRSNDTAARAIVGTHSGLYVMSKGGALFNITPDDLVAGRDDAGNSFGYGTGAYGAGAYGTARADSGLSLDATVWSLDTWGEFPVAVSPDDGRLLKWDLDTSHRAAPIANAPSCTAIVVTGERIIMALGASGDPRLIAWCDQEDDTDWTDSETNQAGSWPLQTSGRLMCGVRVPTGTLLLTDEDAWLAGYVGFPLVYGFQRVGADCGPISRGAVVSAGAMTAWMGTNGFFAYSQEVASVPCEIGDMVFTGLNRSQASKVTAFHNADFNEIWWIYPDKSHVEPNRYALWNYKENHWNTGQIRRGCAVGRGSFSLPLMVSAGGRVYEHEVGFTYDEGDVAYLTTAPLEMGAGDQVVTIKRLIPDERTAGDVTAKFVARMYPNGNPHAYGPYDMSSPTDLRFTCRQLQATFQATRSDDWRLGVPRLEVVTRGRR